MQRVSLFDIVIPDPNVSGKWLRTMGRVVADSGHIEVKVNNEWRNIVSVHVYIPYNTGYDTGNIHLVVSANGRVISAMLESNISRILHVMDVKRTIKFISEGKDAEPCTYIDDLVYKNRADESSDAPVGGAGGAGDAPPMGGAGGAGTA